MAYKIIFLDLDGTLLDDNKNVSKENKEAIRKAEEKGIQVCLCSGRQKNTVKKVKDLAEVNSRYIISSNGTEIYDCIDNEVLFSSNIEKDICLHLYNYVQENNYIIRLDTTYARYLNNMNYKFNMEIEMNEDINKFVNENNTTQITICTETEEQIDKVIEYVKSLNRSDIKIENRFQANNKIFNLWAINIINTNASKGNALYGLCKYLKIDIKDSIAMGDDKNDISMLKMAGLGVAMENSFDNVKDFADEVTKTNNENGVAEIINSKILCL